MESINQFSIVVISYNNKNELRTTLDSLNNLIYPRQYFEVIIVDDGSSEPLKPSVDHDLNFAHQFIYIPRSDSSSRSKARNTGAALASKDFLVFIDGDQYINPDLLATYNIAINNNEKIAAFLGTRIDLTEWQSSHLLETRNYAQLKKITRAQIDFRDYVRVFYDGRYSETLGGWVLFWSHNFAIKRLAFEQVGGFDERFLGWGCEDVELGYRLAKNNILFEFIENHVYHLHEPNKFTPAKYINSLHNLEYFYSKHKDIAIMFKLGFYESFYNSDMSKANHQAVLNAFLVFNRKLTYLHKWSN